MTALDGGCRIDPFKGSVSDRREWIGIEQFTFRTCTHTKAQDEMQHDECLRVLNLGGPYIALLDVKTIKS